EAIGAELAEQGERAVRRVEVFRCELDGNARNRLAQASDDGFLEPFDVDLAKSRQAVSVHEGVEGRHRYCSVVGPVGSESSAVAHTTDPLVGHRRERDVSLWPPELGGSRLCPDGFGHERHARVVSEQACELRLELWMGLDRNDPGARLQKERRPLTHVRADVEREVAAPDEMPVERGPRSVASCDADSVANV